MKDQLKSMNRIQKHAEITYAEAYLIKAILFLITDPNMVGFVREGLAIRQSYATYKACYKYLASIVKEIQMQDITSDVSLTVSEALQKAGVDEHFIQSIYLGMGSFNLILSTIPSRLLRLFEFMGFGGNRGFGLKCLEIGANWPLSIETIDLTKTKKKRKECINFFPKGQAHLKGPGTRRFLCDLNLMLYHIALPSMIQIPGCNMPLARKILSENLASIPESFLYLFFEAKSLQAGGNPKGANEVLNKVVNVARDWRQLSHVCFWDMGMCYIALGDWENAANVFSILYEENKWSKAVYLYLKAICLYTLDEKKYLSTVTAMLKEVPTLCKKVAGKSIPLEKYVARKSKKFALQNNRLLLPAYEAMYMVFN